MHSARLTTVRRLWFDEIRIQLDYTNNIQFRMYNLTKRPHKTAILPARNKSQEMKFKIFIFCYCGRVLVTLRFSLFKLKMISTYTLSNMCFEFLCKEKDS